MLYPEVRIVQPWQYIYGKNILIYKWSMFLQTVDASSLRPTIIWIELGQY